MTEKEFSQLTQDVLQQRLVLLGSVVVSMILHIDDVETSLHSMVLLSTSRDELKEIDTLIVDLAKMRDRALKEFRHAKSVYNEYSSTVRTSEQRFSVPLTNAPDGSDDSLSGLTDDFSEKFSPFRSEDHFPPDDDDHDDMWNVFHSEM